MLRIFISHSAKEPRTDHFLTQLLAALKAAGFDVLVDRERLQPGANWRNELYTCMGLCHGAIILLSESACREGSLWVPRETSILLWRRMLEPNFPVIPIYLDPVTLADVTRGNFADLNLEALQAAPQGETADVIEAIKQQFLQLKVANEKTPLECVAEQIVHLLKDVPQTLVSEQANALGVEVGPWQPQRDPRRLLAFKLLQTPLRHAIDVIEALTAYLDDGAADRLLALVAPSWVDLCAARWIPGCAKCPETTLAIALNAHTFFSAEMYVRRASCQPPKTSWPVYPLSGVYGERAVDEIVNEIEECLIVKFGISPDAFGKRTLQQRLRSALELRQQQGRPVFIVLEYTSAVARLLPELRRALPLVTFFLLTGDELPAPHQLDAQIARRLEPQLELGVEQQAQIDYDYAVSIIRPGF